MIIVINDRVRIKADSYQYTIQVKPKTSWQSAGYFGRLDHCIHALLRGPAAALLSNPETISELRDHLDNLAEDITRTLDRLITNTGRVRKRSRQ